MTDTNYQPRDSAVIQISTYLQQLIVLDILAKVLEAQKKGDDYSLLLKFLSDYAESQGFEREKPEQQLITELCALAARADSFAARLSVVEPCADDSVLDGEQ